MELMYATVARLSHFAIESRTFALPGAPWLWAKGLLMCRTVSFCPCFPKWGNGPLLAGRWWRQKNGRVFWRHRLACTGPRNVSIVYMFWAFAWSGLHKFTTIAWPIRSLPVASCLDDLRPASTAMTIRLSKHWEMRAQNDPLRRMVMGISWRLLGLRSRWGSTAPARILGKYRIQWGQLSVSEVKWSWAQQTWSAWFMLCSCNA